MLNAVSLYRAHRVLAGTSYAAGFRVDRQYTLFPSLFRRFSAVDCDSPEDEEEENNNNNNNIIRGPFDMVEEDATPSTFAIPDSTSVNVSSSTSKLDSLPISFADISRAEVSIRGGVKRTTCEKSHFISELVGANVYLKNEFRQFTGSFKERGARNAILQLMRVKGTQLRGVIAASAGNHALALAYHGQQLGIPVTVVMPTVAPLAKVDKCRVRPKKIITVASKLEALIIISVSFFFLVSGRNLELAFVFKVNTLAKPKSTPKLSSNRMVWIM
jgi:hypothetical protein